LTAASVPSEVGKLGHVIAMTAPFSRSEPVHISVDGLKFEIKPEDRERARAKSRRAEGPALDPRRANRPRNPACLRNAAPASETKKVRRAQTDPTRGDTGSPADSGETAPRKDTAKGRLGE
jgi:hypothetical protein